MAKSVPAARLSIELVAEIARLQSDLDKAKKMVTSASGEIARSAKGANDNLAGMGRGMGVATKSAGQMKAGMQQLSFQLNDVSSGFSSGTPPMQIFAQQASQVVQALQLMNGSTKGLLGFLAGPWGAVLTAATVVLAPFVMKLFQGAEGSKEQEKALKEQAKAIEALDDITGRGNNTQEQRIALGVAATKTILAQTIATRNQIKAELDRAIAGAKIRASLNTDISAEAEGAGIISGALQDRRIKVLTASLKEQNAAIAENEERLRAAGRAALMVNIIAMTDKHAAAVKKLTDAQKLLDQAFDAGKLSPQEYTAKSVVLQNQLHATENATDKATGAIQRHSVAVKSVVDEYAALYSVGAAALITLRNMGAVVTAEDVVKRGRDELAAKIAGEQAVADFRKRAYEQADEDARDRALQAANDVADIVGGRIGQAISQLAAALDRFAAIEISSGKGGKGLGKAFSKISKELGETLQVAAAGAEIGSAVSGIMKGLGIKTSKTGAQAGGAIGGAFGGPIGALAGSIIGGTIGGMLKGVKKASATIELTAGKATMGSLSGNSAGLKKVASAMAGSLISGLVRIADELGGMIGDGIKVSIGQRDKTFRVDLEGLGRTKGMPKFDTEQEAIAFAIKEVIRRGAIIGLRAGTLALVKGEGELEAQLGKALKFENVFKELARIANPVIAGIDAIAKEFTALIDIFEEAGASAEDYAKLQELMAIKQKEAIEAAFEPIRTMLDDLKGKADEAGAAVRTAFEEVLGREGAAVDAYQEAVAAQAEAQAEAVREAFNAGQQRWLDAVTTGFTDEIARIKDAIGPLRDEASKLAQTAEQLRDFAGGIVTPGSSVRFSASAATAAAQAGDLDRLGALRDAAMSGATDRFSQVRNLAILRNAASSAAGGFAGRASGIEAQIAMMEQQVSGIEQQVELAKSQVKTLEAVDKSTVDIARLLSNMETAKAAADVAREQMAKLTELTETEITFADAVAAYETAKAMRDDLIRGITEAGFANLIEVQKQTGAQLLAAVAEVAARAAAAAEAASQAILAAQAAQAAATAAANDNMWTTYDIGYGPVQYRSAPAANSMAAEIGAAVAEQVAPALYQIAKNTGKAAITLEDFDRVGMPDVRSL